MKRIATIFCLAFLLANTASATMSMGQNQEEEKYFINVGNLHMTISENGGKILSLKYDETEVISQLSHQTTASMPATNKKWHQNPRLVLRAQMIIAKLS